MDRGFSISRRSTISTARRSAVPRCFSTVSRARDPAAVPRTGSASQACHWARMPSLSATSTAPPASNRSGCDIGEITHIRTKHDRLRGHGRFDRVLPALSDKASAHENRLRDGVEPTEVTDAIDHHDIGLPGLHVGETGRLEIRIQDKIVDRLGPLRVAGNKQKFELREGRAQTTECSQDGGLLTRVGAARRSQCDRRRANPRIRRRHPPRPPSFRSQVHRTSGCPARPSCSGRIPRDEIAFVLPGRLPARPVRTHR